MENLTQIAPRKIFSRIGITLTVMLLVASVLQIAWLAVVPLIPGGQEWLDASTWGMWLGTFLPLYLVAAPLCILLFSRIPREIQSQNRLGGKNFFLLLLMCFPLMYGGNIIGTLLSFLISGGSSENALMNYALDTNPLKVIVIVFLAPTIEEYIFRKQIIFSSLSYSTSTTASTDWLDDIIEAIPSSCACYC